MRAARRIARRFRRTEAESSRAEPTVKTETDRLREDKRAAKIEREAPARFFDEAAPLTPYVAVEVQRMTFVVATWDRLGRGLFSERRRGEMETLASAVEVLDRLGLGGSRAGSVFADIGANIGTTTISALVRHAFGAAVAVEAEPRNLRMLRANVSLNGLDERVLSLGCAIGESDAEATLALVAGSSGKHRIARSASDAETITVPQRTFDSLVATGELDLRRVGLLWMDTQGSEGHALAGGRTLVERGVPLVAELAPKYLAASGGLPLFVAALRDGYTHIVDLRSPFGKNGSPALRPASDIERLAEAYAGKFTDLLEVRLT